jgi:hypothetical protein
LDHLPVEASTAAQIHRLTAWFASQRQDAALERRELERLIDNDPTDFQALNRLAQLVAEDGDPERAALLRTRKPEIERMVARYQKLHKRNQPRRDAVELARLAGALGQPFEARGFLTLAVALNPDHADLRDDLIAIDKRTKTIVRRGRTLADQIAPELGDDQGSASHLTSRPTLP